MGAKTQNGQGLRYQGMAGRSERRWRVYRISDTFGRIGWDRYRQIIQSACISALWSHVGTSAFEQVDDGDEK